MTSDSATGRRICAIRTAGDASRDVTARGFPKDAQLRRERPRAPPPHRGGSRTRQRRRSGAVRPPDFCLQVEAAAGLGRLTARAPRHREGEWRRSDIGCPTSCICTTVVIGCRGPGWPGCCYRPEGVARSPQAACLLLGRSSHRTRTAAELLQACMQRRPALRDRVRTGILCSAGGSLGYARVRNSAAPRRRLFRGPPPALTPEQAVRRGIASAPRPSRAPLRGSLRSALSGRP
jgi:hypothetical protein